MQDVPHHDLGDITSKLLKEESLDTKVGEIGAALGTGATGKFPEGHLTDSDEGELRIAIGSFQGKVVLSFGKSITWLGLGPHQAKQLSEMIRDKAYAAMARQDDDDPRIKTGGHDV